MGADQGTLPESNMAYGKSLRNGSFNAKVIYKMVDCPLPCLITGWPDGKTLQQQSFYGDIGT